MCTSIALRNEEAYFGRSMDLGCGFNECVAVTPRNYPFVFRKAGTLNSHRAIIGMAQVEDNYPLYAEGCNESGLGMAGLNFPGNAFYFKTPSADKANISPFEIIPWVLGQCDTVKQARELICKSQLTDIPFSEKLPLATLHWQIADKESTIVLECTESGMNIYDNPVNVLTNNPTFDFQLLNLSRYLNLTVKRPSNVFSDNGVQINSLGLGSVGLPGDFSSMSRFVKAAFILMNSKCGCNEESMVSQFFHILDSVAVVNGSIGDNSDEGYYTRYSCCMDLNRGIYYYKTYNNSRIAAINMNKGCLDSKELIKFPLRTHQSILWEN